MHVYPKVQGLPSNSCATKTMCHLTMRINFHCQIIHIIIFIENQFFKAVPSPWPGVRHPSPLPLFNPHTESSCVLLQSVFTARFPTCGILVDFEPLKESGYKTKSTHRPRGSSEGSRDGMSLSSSHPQSIHYVVLPRKQIHLNNPVSRRSG